MKTTTHKNSITIAAVAARDLSMLEAVRAYALGNYEGGWDVIVECWSDEDIMQAVGKSTTLSSSVRKIYPTVKAHLEAMQNTQL